MDNMTSQSIFIFPHSETLYLALAKDFELCAMQAVAEKDRFSVVLSGGNTPKEFYFVLTKFYAKTIPWHKIDFFFGDERYVPMNNSDNNYHMTEEYLFAKIPVDPKRIFPINTNYPTATLAAEAYEKKLREILQLNAEDYPIFDLIYLGLGEDAHTASLFPETALVKAYAQNKNITAEKLVAAYYVEKLKMERISLLPPAINHSKNIHFMISGKNKANAVKAVLANDYHPELYPAQLIKSINGKTEWYLDEEAAAQIL